MLTCFLWFLYGIIWMNAATVAASTSSTVMAKFIDTTPTATIMISRSANDFSDLIRINKSHLVRNFLVPLNWENLECLSSHILRARNKCIENKFNKTSIIDSISACNFYKQVMHCTKLLVIKAIKCQKQGPLDKTLNLESFTKFDTLVLHLCSPKMRKTILQSVFDYNVECGQHLIIGIWSRHEGAIQMEHYISRHSLDINDYLCTDISEFLMEEADHFFKCRHDLVIALYYSLSEILQCQAYLYIKNSIRHNDLKSKQHGLNFLHLAETHEHDFDEPLKGRSHNNSSNNTSEEIQMLVEEIKHDELEHEGVFHDRKNVQEYEYRFPKTPCPNGTSINSFEIILIVVLFLAIFIPEQK